MKAEVEKVLEMVRPGLQADGGTHVHSTREVGGITVVKTENKGKPANDYY